MAVCLHCGLEGEGKYCQECGHPHHIKRITISSVLHEVAHIFTHFEKGFAFTIKELALHPGNMQRDYIRGYRQRHQKPFSLFFVSATLAGLAIYWIGHIRGGENLSHFDEVRDHFYRHYYVILQSLLIPFYSLVIWILFRNRELNYAEVLVLFVYSLAFLFLIVIFVNAIDLIPHRFETYWVELPLLAGYIIWTNLNFFRTEPRWLIILKSIVSLVGCWMVSQWVTNEVIRWMA